MLGLWNRQETGLTGLQQGKFECEERIIRHPQFIGKPKNLYHADGVHLSKLGNYLFLNNIQGAIEYFVKDDAHHLLFSHL